MATLQEITSEDSFDSLLSSNPTSLTVLYFHTPWAAPCAQMTQVLQTLASTYPADNTTLFLSINAEDLPDISESHNVTAVPFIVLQRANQTLETVSGSDASKVRAAVERHAAGGAAKGRASIPPLQEATPRQPTTTNGTSHAAKDLSAYAPSPSDPQTAPQFSANGISSSSTADEKADLQARLEKLVHAAPVMLFMKGTPSAPQCGFSRQLVSILRENGVKYGFFNILADEDVRQGLKEYADWPTFPQLWTRGELVGGLDIVSFSSSSSSSSNHLGE